MSQAKARREKMSEQAIERYLVQSVKEMGGLCLKFTSPGQAGVPDRLIILPGGQVFFAELKAKGGRQSPRQKVMAEKLEQLGCQVQTLFGKEEVQRYLEDLEGLA